MKRLTIEVKGNTKRWGFEFDGDPKYLDEWRADGLDVCELVNVIPAWVVDIGLTHQWCLLQDIFYGAIFTKQWWRDRRGGGHA